MTKANKRAKTPNETLRAIRQALSDERHFDRAEILLELKSGPCLVYPVKELDEVTKEKYGIPTS